MERHEKAGAAPEIASLLENLARSNLSAAEEARACGALSDLGLTQLQIGQRTGRNPNTVSNLIRLAKLPEEILGLIDDGKLTGSHGKALLVAKDPEARRQLARKAAELGWPVLTLEARARLSNENVPGALNEQVDPPLVRRQGRKGPAPVLTAGGRELDGEEARAVVGRAAMIAWTDSLGASTAEALASREGSTAVALASERLEEAVGLGLMEEHRLLVGYPVLYTATRAGRSLARRHVATGAYRYPAGLGIARVPIKDARHTIACASVAGALERRYPDYRIMSERELRREESAQGRRLASVDARAYGTARSHYPDLVLWPPAADACTREVRDRDLSTAKNPEIPLPVAVEVELTLKYRDRLAAILRALARSRHLEATIYYAGDQRIEERLLDVVDDLQLGDSIIVNPLSEIVPCLRGFDLSPWEGK